jgi:LPLT family lysophospholipid transporter-like MFS transporter
VARPEGGLSLAVTTIFWGVGATLQFIVLRWAAEQLQLPLSTGGLPAGRGGRGRGRRCRRAGRWVPLSAAPSGMLGFGVLLGLAMPLLAQVDSLGWRCRCWWLVGAVGGLLVVPLNALLQHRGCQLLSAGRSIAVQGFNENASVLAMLAPMPAWWRWTVPLPVLMTGLRPGRWRTALLLLMLRAWRSDAAPGAQDLTCP